jgi:hypothetical protein
MAGKAMFGMHDLVKAEERKTNEALSLHTSVKCA